MNNVNERMRVLDCAQLMDDARSTAGLSDFGDLRFRPTLERYLQRAAREADFKEGALESFRGDVIRYLVNRLRMTKDIQAHPEILEENVSDPVVVMGLPRSGTTKLHRMLAAADGIQKTFLWQLLNPSRFPGEARGDKASRLAAATMGDSFGSEASDKNKALQAAHELAANQVEEEFVLFDFYLDESVRGFNHTLPIFFFDEWAPGQDRETDREAYRYLRQQFQYLQWQDGGRRNRPWVMKSVTHIAHLDALLEVFPKATLVHCHRTPISSVPSHAKLMEVMWNFKVNVDKQVTGRALMEWAAAAVERYLNARRRLALDDRIIDVRYEDIREDVMPSIEAIYQRAGWTLGDEERRTMEKWEAENEQGKHGAHVYTLEEYGMSKPMIEDAFQEYMRRFIQ